MTDKIVSLLDTPPFFVAPAGKKIALLEWLPNDDGTYFCEVTYDDGGVDRVDVNGEVV